MNLSNEHLQILLTDPKLGPEIIAYDEFSNTDLSNLDKVSELDLIRLNDALTYAIENWSDLFQTYENPPLMEMEPSPICIYKTPRLYIVIEQWIDSKQANFFLTESEAISFADDAYSSFMDWYKSVIEEN
jgi:hypothetical protein